MTIPPAENSDQRPETVATPDKSAEIAGMFGRIARRYDLLNHTLSMGIDYWWRHRLVRHVQPGPTGRVLDLAAGTMDVSLAIRRRYPELAVMALDFSRPMLEYGRNKVLRRKVTDIFPAVADARALPLADACVDCVTIAFGIRNINPRPAAFAEMLRVLAPGGRALVLEFGGNPPRVWKGLYAFYLKNILPRIGRLISGDAAYGYLADTIAAFPEAEVLAGEMLDAGFHRVSHLPMTSGIVTLHIAEKAASSQNRKPT